MAIGNSIRCFSKWQLTRVGKIARKKRGLDSLTLAFATGVMRMIRNLLATMPFLLAWVIAVFCGVHTAIYLKQSISAPWPHVAALFVTLAVFLFVNGFLFNRILFRKAIEKNTPVFEFNEECGTITYPDEDPVEIIWSDVERIEIITTNDGPWSEDFWWLFYLKGTESPIDVPQGAKGNEGIFDVLKKNFEGHDMETIMKALGSTSEARFNVWQAHA